MQQEFSFIKQANSLAKFEPMQVEKVGDKIWFSYANATGSIVPAYYDCKKRKFQSVVHAEQYNKVAVRNVVARPVIEKLFQAV